MFFYYNNIKVGLYINFNFLDHKIANEASFLEYPFA